MLVSTNINNFQLFYLFVQSYRALLHLVPIVFVLTFKVLLKINNVKNVQQIALTLYIRKYNTQPCKYYINAWSVKLIPPLNST